MGARAHTYSSTHTITYARAHTFTRTRTCARTHKHTAAEGACRRRLDNDLVFPFPFAHMSDDHGVPLNPTLDPSPNPTLDPSP